MTGNNGLEVYRLLVQQNEPASKNASMNLLSVIMSWPAFNVKSSLMQQLLKLEHANSEYERLGTKLNDDLKTAVLMCSITGQLRTWLQLQVNESTTYSKVREIVMMYDSLGNSCMTTHSKNDTHKSRRVVLVFHISHMRISL